MRPLRALAFLAAVLGVSLLSPRAARAYQAGTLKNHSHNSVAGQGGATVNATTSQTLSILIATQTHSGVNSFTGAVSFSSGITKMAGGNVVQSTSVIDCGEYTATTYIPIDGSIPQLTEGLQAFSSTFTMRSSTNKIRFTAHLQVSPATSARTVSAALFVNEAADAVTASAIYGASNATLYPLLLNYEEAGYTGARLYELRFGQEPSQNAYINRTSVGTANPFGAGKTCSTFQIEEFTPSP